jgi:hypothetical protein
LRVLNEKDPFGMRTFAYILSKAAETAAAVAACGKAGGTHFCTQAKASIPQKQFATLLLHA